MELFLQSEYFAAFFVFVGDAGSELIVLDLLLFRN
jgi:hypothetical protein